MPLGLGTVETLPHQEESSSVLSGAQLPLHPPSVKPLAWCPTVTTTPSGKRKETLAVLTLSRHEGMLFSSPVVSDSLRPHGRQPARLPWPSPSPELAQAPSIVAVMPSNHLVFHRLSPYLQSLSDSGSFNESTLCLR